MILEIIKIGRSAGVVFPKEFMEENNLKAGDTVYVDFRKPTQDEIDKWLKKNSRKI